MTPINILYALAQFVPGLLHWAGKDNAAEVAEKAVEAAKVITGKDQLEDQLAEFKANPELLLQYQKVMYDVTVAQLQADTARLESINATMRVEYASSDTFTRRWRPTMGYAVTIAWFLQMLALTYVIVFQIDKAPQVINAVAALTAIWGIALSVLGVAVVKRSEDKQTAAGFQPAGIIGSIAKAAGIGK